MKLRVASNLVQVALATATSFNHQYPLPKPPYRASATPEVNLGYERHTAIVDDEAGFYNFSNIPYAQPPLGKLRFAVPEPLAKIDNPPLNDGSVGHICPQVQVGWVPKQLGFIAGWTAGIPLTPWTSPPDPDTPLPEMPPQDPRVNEDCLVLDVVVPKPIFDAIDKDDFYPAPVVVWIHGGGFIFGDKNQFGSPSGIFNASAVGSTQEEDGVIYVTLNYRLGAFGWLSSPDFISDGGRSNAGFFDQKIALQWVRDNILLFGGDPDRVTVIGESAGAASIMHHITSYGGPRNPWRGTRAPFKRAILQSPGFIPLADDKQEKKIYNTFLEYAGVTNLGELREADTAVLQNASNTMVFRSAPGQFAFGPAVDQDFVPAPPSLLLKYNKFWSDLDIMVAHNGNEGLLFSPPWIQDDAGFRAHISESLPALTAEDLNDIERLYPAPSNPDNDRSRIQRLANATAELGVVCNAQYLIQAFGTGNVFKYVFNIFPGFHGQDAFYTFYNPPPIQYPSILTFPRVALGTQDVALALQSYIANFAKWSNPNSEHYPEFLRYDEDPGNGKTITEFWNDGRPFNPTGHQRVVEDRWYNSVNCEYWQDAPYWKGEDEGEVPEREI